jgi:hypothetical protein
VQVHQQAGVVRVVQGDPPGAGDVCRCRGEDVLDVAVAGISGLDPVTIKSFLAFGMLLNTMAALDVTDLDEPWAEGVRTRIHAGLFEHITTDTNR